MGSGDASNLEDGSKNFTTDGELLEARKYFARPSIRGSLSSSSAPSYITFRHFTYRPLKSIGTEQDRE